MQVKTALEVQILIKLSLKELEVEAIYLTSKIYNLKAQLTIPIQFNNHRVSNFHFKEELEVLVLQKIYKLMK